ncbi:MAG: hypothetical protein R3300_14560 [Candidatus Promineifilaceae bacterium]|nr:hypothetical protein [Candidatus Promineifilaceae bacterium]
MKQTSYRGALLTLLMFLLVLVATVIFLADRKESLEVEARQRADRLATLTGEQAALRSDLAVREAALALAEGTRVALATRAAAEAEAATTLTARLADGADRVQTLEAELQRRAVQAFIVSPQDGAETTAGAPLEVVLVAAAEGGLAQVTLAVDGEVIGRYPGGGLARFTNRVPWTPPAAGSYELELLVEPLDGGPAAQSSVALTVQPPPPAVRAAALQAEVAGQLAALRPLTATVPLTTAPVATGLSPSTALSATLCGALAGGGPDPASGPQAAGPTPTTATLPAAPLSPTVVLQALELAPADYGPADLADLLAVGPLLARPDPQGGPPQFYRPDESEGPLGRWLAVRAATLAGQPAAAVGLQAGTALSPTAAVDGDAALARLAWREGEAALLQRQYAGAYLPDPVDQADLAAALAGAAVTLPADTPPYLRAALAFPFVQGGQFAAALFDQGGWAALDGVDERPPLSSEQILHPDRYLAGDAPRPVTLAAPTAVLSDGWRLAGSDAFGEFQLRHYLQPEISGPALDQAAGGWGGGRYAVYTQADGDGLAVLLRLAWDAPAERAEFASALDTRLRQRSGDAGRPAAGGGFCWQGSWTTCLYNAGADSLLVRAPTLALAQALAATQPDVIDSTAP